jgi:hypothetical protein
MKIINWKIKMLLALLNVFVNIAMLVFGYLNNNQIVLAWSIGYASFSTYYLNQQIKEVRRYLEYGREYGRVAIKNA